MSTSFSAEYLYHKGNYPFQMQNGNNVIRERRQDSDMQLLRLKLAVYGVINDKQQLSTNVFYYRSEQGLPGAVIFIILLCHNVCGRKSFVQTHYENVMNKNSISIQCKMELCIFTLFGFQLLKQRKRNRQPLLATKYILLKFFCIILFLVFLLPCRMMCLIAL